MEYVTTAASHGTKRRASAARKAFIVTVILILATAFGFGAMHAFEPDHMAAVSTFVARRPTPRQAISLGVRWAIGHGLSLLIIGSVLFVLKMALQQSQPVLFSSGVLDRFVGIVLVLLGLCTSSTCWGSLSSELSPQPGVRV